MFRRTKSITPDKELLAALQRVNAALDATPDDPRLLTERGEICIRANRFDDAISNFTQALKVDSLHIPAVIGMARAYFAQGETNRALQLLMKAEQFAPNNPDIYSLEGEILAVNNQDARAAQAFTKALTLAPGRTADLLNRARLLIKNKRFDLAGADLNAVLAVQPNLAEALHLRAMALRAASQLDAALTDHDLAVATEPNNPLYALERGVTLLNLKRYEQAIRDFEAVLKRDPDNISALYHHGLALAALGRQRPALNEFDKVIKLDRRHIGALNARGEILLQQQNWQRLEENETMLIEVDPNAAHAHMRRGYGRLAMRLADDAITDFTRALVIEPNNGEAYKMRAEIHLMRGDRERVKSDLEQAIARGVRAPESLELLARLHNEDKNYVEAIKYYTMAIDTQPDKLDLRRLRGLAAYHARDLVLALADFERVASATKKPEPALLFNLGSVYLETGAFEEAAECFEEAMEAGLKDAATQLALADATYHLGEVKEARKMVERVLKSTQDPGVKVEAERLLNKMKK